MKPRNAEQEPSSSYEEKNIAPLLEAQLNRARISAAYFDKAAIYLKAYSPKLELPLRRALLEAAVVAYACPFGTSKGGVKNLATGTLIGNPKTILLKQEFELHTEVLRLRDNSVAHANYDSNPFKRVEGSNAGFIAWGRMFDILGSDIKVPLFLKTCEKMENHCTGLLFSLNGKLSRELVQ